MIPVVRAAMLLTLAGLSAACSRDQPMDAWIQSWDGGDGAALLVALAQQFPSASDSERRSALERIARGPCSPASTRAAAALCRLAGLGEPHETAYRLYNKPGDARTEPQWFLWNAGYSYNWICNSGLSACYFGFGDRQFADRIRVYEAIGAHQAAQVLRETDLAFGPNGPAASLEGRQAKISAALDATLDALSPRFWKCGDEINTRSYLYALEHPDDFRLP